MKIRNVIISDDALSDLDAAKAFYDSKELGVGEYFIGSLISDLDSLTFYSGIHVKQCGFFRMSSKRFPFGIYYEINQDTVMIIAILDMRRDPTWLDEQLETRKT